MGFSEIPPPPESEPGQDEPAIRVRPPGPQSRTWLTRFARTAPPMGAQPQADLSRGIRADIPRFTVVYATGKGSNVIDVDSNRYVDLAAGFGALLLGHNHPRITKVLELQSERLLQALGDVYPADARIALGERLAQLFPGPDGQVILGQSGADAVTAALKTACLATGKPRVLAFSGAYHGLSYAPLAACGLRESYRAPFRGQLGEHVEFHEYPPDHADDSWLASLRQVLAGGDFGAVLIEPVLGRGGALVPASGLMTGLRQLTRDAGALFIADEIWTGLGRSGSWLASSELEPDLICLGKGLGGGLPISACLGSAKTMAAWSQEREVVHTSTFAGAPLACATAIATLDVLKRDNLVERAQQVGTRFANTLRQRLATYSGVTAVRGAGLMIGIEFGNHPGVARRLMTRLLEKGYLVTTGGGQRDVLMLTPPLNISESLLTGFIDVLDRTLEAVRW